SLPAAGDGPVTRALGAGCTAGTTPALGLRAWDDVPSLYRRPLVQRRLLMTRTFSASRLRRRATHYRPRLEALEDRNLLSIFPVDRLPDAGPTGGGVGSGLAGDLRYCINQANGVAGDDIIRFSVMGTINLASALPNLTSNIDIQGPGAANLTMRPSPAVG